MRRPQDIMGSRFGRLRILYWIPSWICQTADGKWRCQCECGKETGVSRDCLIQGKVRSCGCLVRDKNTTHGESKNPSYGVWYDMIRRCTDPTSPAYPDYGGRGISVATRWLDIKNFIAAMGCPPEGMVLDRINNDGSYCKENCRWATLITSQNNKRNNRRLTLAGETLTAAEWSRKLGLDYKVITWRLGKNWSVADVLLRPVRARECNSHNQQVNE